MIISGLNPAGDLQHGVGLVKKGCEGGYFRACANLGYIYFTGTGVARDIDAAAKYYQRGCDGGSAAACRNLGLMVSEGQVVLKSGLTADALFDPHGIPRHVEVDDHVAELKVQALAAGVGRD